MTQKFSGKQHNIEQGKSPARQPNYIAFLYLNLKYRTTHFWCSHGSPLVSGPPVGNQGCIQSILTQCLDHIKSMVVWRHTARLEYLRENKIYQSDDKLTHKHYVNKKKCTVLTVRAQRQVYQPLWFCVLFAFWNTDIFVVFYTN